MFLKNILQLYALFICSISVIILFVVSGLTLNSFTDLIIPEYKNYSSMSHYESNEAYIKFREERWNPNKNELKNEIIALRLLTPQALTEQRVKAKQDFLENQRRNNIQHLIIYFEWAIVALLFFYIHWRIYKKETKKSL